MDLGAMSIADLIGVLVGFMLTLFVFSYIFGDNGLFRLAIHVFIGVAAAYAAVVAWYNVIWPQLVLPLWTGSQQDRLITILPLVLTGLLLTKASPRLAGLGNPAMAFLVGVGVAAAIGGAVLGTLFPQSSATVNLFDPQLMPVTNFDFTVKLAENALILIGVVSTLIYFQFSARPQPAGAPQRAAWIEWLASVGQIFIAITLGALFAGIYAAALSAFIERLNFVVQLVISLIQP